MTGNAYQRIETALIDHGCDVKTEGAGQLRASCPNPSHEHGNRKSPALQVTDHGDKVGIYCHGCDDKPAILAALGMTTSDLFDEPLDGHSDGSHVVMDLPVQGAGEGSKHRSAGRRPRALAGATPAAPAGSLTEAQRADLEALTTTVHHEYHYTDEAGEVQFTVTRDGHGHGKRIKPTETNKQIEDGGRQTDVLYQLPAVISAVTEGHVVYLVEGEKDCEAAAILGLTATTGRAGSGGIGKADLSPLKGAHVVAVVDRDPAGDKWAKVVRERLEGSAASLSFMRSATTGEGADLYDHLHAGYGIDQLVDFQGSGEDANDRDSKDEDNKAGLLSRVRSGIWLDRQDFPPLVWAIPGLISEGYGLLVGAPKLGKSWFVLSTLLALADGKPTLGAIDVDRRPVLYAALEDGDRRMQRRCRKLLGVTPIPAGFEYLTRATSEEIFDLIPLWLSENPNGVVALDTLGKVLPPAQKGQGAYERDYEVGTRLKAMVDAYPGSTLLVVHHDRKARSADFMEATSGTNGLNGAADFTIVLSRERNSEIAAIQVTGRDIIEGEYLAILEGRVNWKLDGANLEEAAEAFRDRRGEQERESLSEDTQNVLDFVRTRKVSTSALQVAEHLGWKTKDGKPDNDKAGKYLRRLEKSGHLASPMRGSFVAPLRPVSEVSELSETEQDDSAIRTNRTVRTHSTAGEGDAPSAPDLLSATDPAPPSPVSTSTSSAGPTLKDDYQCSTCNRHVAVRAEIDAHKETGKCSTCAEKGIAA